MTGLLPLGNLPTTLARTDTANTWSAGVKQTFAPNATTAGLNVGSFAGDPSTPANGDLWYDSTANELTARINGASVALGPGGGGGVTPSTALRAAFYNAATTVDGATGLTFATGGATITTLELRRTARSATATLGTTDGPVVECTATAPVILTLPPTWARNAPFGSSKWTLGLTVVPCSRPRGAA